MENYLKHAVISAYNDKIEELNKSIAGAKATREEVDKDIAEFENEKIFLGRECTEVLKQMDEKGLPEIKTFEFTPGDKFEFTEEACERTNNWVKKHELMCHTPEYLKLTHPYKGCTPSSNYELRIGWTALGRYVSLVCTECEKCKEYMQDYEYNIEEIG